MHSKTLKRKAAEEMEIANFIAEWSPIHCPDFSLSFIARPTKARRTDKALARAGKADFHVPDVPPNSPNTPITRLSRAKSQAKAPLSSDTFQPTTAQKSWIKKNPSLEAKYRRNHKLRTDFADTAAALKPALLELATRTLKKLEEGEHWHEEGENLLSHYVMVQELEKRMNGKIECSKTRMKLQKTMSEKQYEHDKTVIENEFKTKVEGMREKALAQIRDDMVWGGYDMDEDENVRASLPPVSSNLGARS